MKQTDIKFDCRHFRGAIPCRPNKLRDKVCPSCDEYDPVRRRILIIKLGAIGDVIRTTPLLRRFREIERATHFTWITHSPAVLSADWVDEIHRFEFNSVYAVRHRQYDIAINLDKDPEACSLLQDVDAGEKYGFGLRDGHLFGLNDAAADKLVTGAFDSISRQTTKSYLEEMFEICGMTFRGEKYVLEPDPDYVQKWRKLREEAGGRPIVALNTGCGTRWLTRLWPEAHWEQFIDRLQRADYLPMLLGGPDEHEQNLRLQEKTGAAYPGTFSLAEFMGIASNTDAVVTAVTMMMHVALGLGKPLVLFNNIFNRNEFELYDNGEIVEPPVGCDCYYGNSCSREDHCMEALAVDSVFEALSRQLPAS